MQDFARIEVADSCHKPLIEQSHFDRPGDAAESLPPQIGCHFKRVGAEPGRAHEHVQLFGGQQADGSQTSAVPEPDRPLSFDLTRFGADQSPFNPQMLGIGRVAQEHQPGHSGFDYKRRAGIELQNDPLGPAAGGDNGSADRLLLEEGQGRREGDRTTGAGAGPDIDEPRSGHGLANPANHRLDFRKFRHGVRTELSGSLVGKRGESTRSL